MKAQIKAAREAEKRKGEDFLANGTEVEAKEIPIPVANPKEKTKEKIDEPDKKFVKIFNTGKNWAIYLIPNKSVFNLCVYKRGEKKTYRE